MDIGFGGALTPRPTKAEFPPLLDFPAPRLTMYRRETSIAEKFDFSALSSPDSVRRRMLRAQPRSGRKANQDATPAGGFLTGRAAEPIVGDTTDVLMSETNLSVWVEDQIVCIRIAGRASFTCSADF